MRACGGHHVGRAGPLGPLRTHAVPVYAVQGVGDLPHLAAVLVEIRYMVGLAEEVRPAALDAVSLVDAICRRYNGDTWHLSGLGAH